jgi:hypothetical protein
MLEVIHLKRMLHAISISALVVLLAACAPQQQAPETNRVYERAGQFSYVPPVGWKAQSSKSFKYQIVVGPINNGFAANMNFQIEETNMLFKDYVDLSRNNISKLVATAVIKSRNAFEVKSGSSAAKIVWEANINQRNAHINSYLMDGKTQKFVITCARAVTQPASIDLECDQTARSFRIE